MMALTISASPIRFRDVETPNRLRPVAPSVAILSCLVLFGPALPA